MALLLFLRKLIQNKVRYVYGIELGYVNPPQIAFLGVLEIVLGA